MIKAWREGGEPHVPPKNCLFLSDLDFVKVGAPPFHFRDKFFEVINGRPIMTGKWTERRDEAVAYSN